MLEMACCSCPACELLTSVLSSAFTVSAAPPYCTLRCRSCSFFCTVLYCTLRCWANCTGRLSWLDDVALVAGLDSSFLAVAGLGWNWRGLCSWKEGSALRGSGRGGLESRLRSVGGRAGLEGAQEGGQGWGSLGGCGTTGSSGNVDGLVVSCCRILWAVTQSPKLLL